MRATTKNSAPAEPQPWCLDWTIAAERVADDTVEVSHEADASEKIALASALGFTAVKSLSVTATASPMGADRILVHGRAHAEIEQACVVTLEPVAQSIDETFTVEFWPAGQIKPEPRPEVEIANADAPEPLTPAGVPLGRIVYEVIASNADPYPRAENASLQLPETSRNQQESPFAILARLKDKNTNSGNS